MALRSIWTELVDLVLPDTCPGCGEPSTPPACSGCLRLLTMAPWLATPDPRPDGLVVPWAVAVYDGPVRSLVVAHKEHARLSLTAPLGAALARAVAAAVPDARTVVLVPVPSTRPTRRNRGHDPTLRLARRAARVLGAHGVPATVVRLLRHARRVVDQAGLSQDARRANLTGALTVAVRGGLPARVVIIDDVVTSGATLTEAVRALRIAGVVVEGTAVVAATPRRTGVHRTGVWGRAGRALPSRRPGY